MPTVGVSPGTFTIQLNGCPPDPSGWYQFGIDDKPIMSVGTPGGHAQIVSPYANEVQLSGVTIPRRAFGLRLDILGAVLGAVVVTGLVVGALASGSR